jgi:ribose 5-phosphate isomerase B
MLAIGSDHGGFTLKEEIKKYLDLSNIAYKDFGTKKASSCDYPQIALKVATAVAKGEHQNAILICGTGIGISIAANKVKGIRAACCNDLFSARLSREHNNANILCLGGRIIAPDLAFEIIKIFFNTEFEGDRHKTRVDLIADIERNN